MTWSTAFRAALADPVLEPRFVLKSLALGVSWERSFTWSTHPLPFADQVLVVDEGRMRLQHGAVMPTAWRWSAGSLTLGLVDGVDLSGLARGQVVELLVALGSAGELADYTRVWLGSLDQIAMSGRRWSVTCRALEGALTTRYRALDDDDAGADPSLFRQAGTSTTLSSNYTAGDATLSVGSTSGAARPTGAGVFGVRITPTTGDPFVLTATGATSTTFTGVAAAGAMDTTPVDAVAGDAVSFLAYDEAHPADVAVRIICAAGDFDRAYPQTWSLGLPSDVFDLVDTDAQVALATLVARTTSPAWVLAEDAPVRSAGEYLASMLGAAGFWLCQRQGKLVVRAVHRIEDIPATHFPTAADIVRWSYQAFGAGVEYRGVQISDRGERIAGQAPTEAAAEFTLVGVWAAFAEAMGGGAPPIATEASDVTTYGAIGGAGPRSMPAAGYYRRALPVYGTTADRSAWRTEVGLRTLNYDTRVPELLTLTLRGWQWSELAAGDVICPSWPAELFNSRRGSSDPVTKGGPLLILGGGADFPSPTCTFQCLALPPADTE